MACVKSPFVARAELINNIRIDGKHIYNAYFSMVGRKSPKFTRIFVHNLIFFRKRYSPDAKQEAPRWACALCAIGLFVYQSLDAIDGKQARRTGTSTPLGELFDHGCDSISTIFVALSACIAVQLGHYPTWMFFQVYLSNIIV